MLSVFAAAQKPLDHSVYDSWKSIAQRSISNDGKWVAFAITPQEGDNVVHIKSIDGKVAHTIERGQGVSFSADNRFVIMSIVPKFLEIRQATRDRKPADQRPKNSLLVLDLQTGKKWEMADVSGFSLPDEDAGWFLYRPEIKREPNAPAAPGGGAPAAGGPGRGGRGGGRGGNLEEAEDIQAQPAATQSKKLQGHAPGTKQVLRNFASGQEIILEHVVNGQFTDDGKNFVYSVSTPSGEGDGIRSLNLESRKETVVVSQIGRYPRFVLDEKGNQIAYVTDKDDYKARDGVSSLYLYNFRNGQTREVAKPGTPGLPADWVLSTGGTFGFSKSGGRLMFATRPKPVADPPAVPDDEKVDVDIWSWTDEVLMSAQLLQIGSERNRSYEAIYFVADHKVVQLENAKRPSVIVGGDGDSDWGIFTDSGPYRRSASWNPGYADLYLVNVKSGNQDLVAKNRTGTATFSSDGRYVLFVDGDAQEINAYNLGTKRSVRLNDGPEGKLFFDELNDTPNAAGLYGIAGWTKNDDRLLIYDRFDIWALDPTGKEDPVNLTRNARNVNMVYRYVNLDPEQEFVPTDKDVLIASFNERTKASGYAKTRFDSPQRPSDLIFLDMRVGGLQKAKNSDAITFTKQTFEIYPDVWSSTLEFKDQVRLSDANPQQKDYLWGSAEIVEWVSTDGEPLQGILVKPGGFEYGKKYPMVAYFYERESDNLHAYRTPAPSASTINISYFASNGYAVFIPDIPYKNGYPGESAMSAIIPGVHKVLSLGFVDKDRMGIQGQSWGGYQVAYMVTETNMFKAAGAGAPVSNMFSAYGGIRWGSGLVRQMQYEHGQSRIDGTMWDKPLRYLENSPIFFVDKVKTPLLIMSNDKDGAVPWYQGIELFTALRRLEKPAWLLVYNNEDHNLVQRKNRKDLSIRLSQFFDHYLKGAPMPVWMAKGVPAVDKGRTMGTEVTMPAVPIIPKVGG